MFCLTNYCLFTSHLTSYSKILCITRRCLQEHVNINCFKFCSIMAKYQMTTTGFVYENFETLRNNIFCEVAAGMTYFCQLMDEITLLAYSSSEMSKRTFLTRWTALRPIIDALVISFGNAMRTSDAYKNTLNEILEDNIKEQDYKSKELNGFNAELIDLKNEIKQKYYEVNFLKKSIQIYMKSVGKAEQVCNAAQEKKDNQPPTHVVVGAVRGIGLTLTGVAVLISEQAGLLIAAITESVTEAAADILNENKNRNEKALKESKENLEMVKAKKRLLDNEILKIENDISQWKWKVDAKNFEVSNLSKQIKQLTKSYKNASKVSEQILIVHNFLCQTFGAAEVLQINAKDLLSLGPVVRPIQELAYKLSNTSNICTDNQKETVLSKATIIEILFTEQCQIDIAAGYA